MSKQNKYASYFDEAEENGTNNNSKSQLQDHSPSIKNKAEEKDNYKIPKSKPRKNSTEMFDKPNQPIQSRQVSEENDQDLEELDLEQLYSQPFSNSLISGKQIEHYDSLNALYQNYADEDMDYEMLDMKDLEQLMGENYNPEIENASLDEQIEFLEKQFEEDKENYEVLFKLIYLYRMIKRKDKLRQMREYTYNLFPLGDDMWKEWITDEIADIPPENFEARYELIKSHFDRALNDFYCNLIFFIFLKLDLKICKKQIKYLIKLKKEATNKNIQINEDKFPLLTIESIRRRLEQYLEIWGLDFNQPCLWDIYLTFELSNLDKYKKENDETNIINTINLIRSIYRRRLSFPHIDLDIVWSEYKKWEKDTDELNKVEFKYHDSSKKAEDMINIEEKFNELIDLTKNEDDSSKLSELLKNEISITFKKHFNYIRLYFERALEINPDDEDIWNLYIEITKSINKNSSLTFSILQRACKCCYFDVKFWVQFLREMEKIGRPFDEIQAKIQEAYSSAEDENFVSEIWKYSLEYYSRNFDSSVEQLQQIRGMFSSAISDIQNKGNKDYIIKILLIWAEFETYKVKDRTQVIDLVNRIVKLNPSADNWKTFIFYEKYFGDIESIRKAYKRSLEYCKEEKDYFSENWIIFGTISDIEYALNFSKMRNIKKQRKPIKLSLRSKREEGRDGRGGRGGRECRNGREGRDGRDGREEKHERHNKNENKENIIERKERKVRKLTNKTDNNDKMLIDSDEPKAKGKSIISTSNMNLEVDKNINNSNKTVIIKNLTLVTTEEDLEIFIKNLIPDIKFQDIRIVRDKKGISKGFAFIDFFTKEDAHECVIILNNKVLDDNPVYCAVSKPPKLGENDKRTIFVNNISYDSTDDKIKSAFEPYGQILDIRIIYDKDNKRPKGYCYVEFANEESVYNVMKNKSNFIIEGRKVMVKSSQSVIKLRENIKFVAHITNLPFSITETKLKEFFNKNGIDKIRDCLITKDDQGNSKGFGFIEFEDEDNLKKSLQLTGKIIRGRPVTIKLSTRNITRNTKRKASNDLENDIEVKKKPKIEKTEIESDDVVKHSEIEITSAGVSKPIKKTMSNLDFKKFLK